MKKFLLLFLIFNINFIKPAEEAKYNFGRSLISKIDWLKVSDEQKKHIVNYLVGRYAYWSIIKYIGCEKNEAMRLRKSFVSSLENIEPGEIFGLVVRLKSGDNLIAFASMVYNHISEQYKNKCGPLLKPEKYIVI